MKRFTTQPMLKILEWIELEKSRCPGEPIKFACYRLHDSEIEYNNVYSNVYSNVYNDIFAGALVTDTPVPHRYRSFQNLVDLADATHCRLHKIAPVENWLEITLKPLKTSHPDALHGEGTEKYGTHTPYSRILKLEDPAFASDYTRALTNAGIGHCHRLLDLGVNQGAELTRISQLNPNTHCTGIDHSASAIRAAKEQFISKPFEFIEYDINKIDELYLKRYNIILSLGTLHSPGIDSKRVFMWCVQHLLEVGGSVIIGFPNCRWIDGEPVYGSKTKNRREQDLSLVVKDVYFVKKYLQQHKFNVTIFGKYYLFVVGVPQNL